ncbi:carbohydrate kinase-like protein [Caloranaerobacter sp. TR13]|uniref:NAD(P)H-hydrate dehydratase n=1 Tax=Caloranaerobacter sp. TR13 TaxID=1302151 RepID=UPI0006D3D771|nr:NAD(P)H-hydrate dehydratase [Caloranaerobacter sp. TR13]KPU26689.1 carbohydrate kinase-like protein [Caloranaerobacter sp. TR13]
MIKGNGIDIIEIDRIEKAIKNEKFIERIFCEEERDYFIKRNMNIKTIAGMFAGKEAVSKALGQGIRNYKWTDIKVLHDSLGKPFIVLSGNAENIARKLGIENIQLSISHCDTYAVAFAVAEGKREYKDIIKIEEEVKNKVMTIDKARVSRIIPRRKAYSHKGTYGRVGILAGSLGMTGAAYLTSTACLRSGSGLVYLFTPKSLNKILEIKTTEVITIPVEDNGKGHFCIEGLEYILKTIENMDVLAIGPGLGVDFERTELVKQVLLNYKKTIVLDADGINCLANSTEVFKQRKGKTIITPHPGELSRLLDISIKEIESDRVKYAQLTSEKFGVITVLKGANTVISSEEGKIYINTTGNPGMATAGSGDVLTGIITSFIGQGIECLAATVAGVYVHGLAGDLAKYEKGEYGLIATDVLEHIPYSIKSLIYNS